MISLALKVQTVDVFGCQKGTLSVVENAYMVSGHA